MQPSSDGAKRAMHLLWTRSSFVDATQRPRRWTMQLTQLSSGAEVVLWQSYSRPAGVRGQLAEARGCCSAALQADPRRHELNAGSYTPQ